jgi:molybdopterin molybdotransferase
MDLDASKLLTVDEAIKLIDQLPVRPRIIQAPLAEAIGLRLARDLTADRDYPPFDKSLMDGYAVRAGDVSELLVVGESAAGAPPSRGISSGEAMTVMTGAAIPTGADAVVPIEQTDSASFAKSGERIRVLRAATAGQFIAPQGSDIRRGGVALAGGAPINAAHMAVASCIGATTIPAWDRPRCTVLATGNEIVPADQTPAATQLRNSNSPMLLALLNKLGCAARDLGIAADQPDRIKAAIQDGLRDDILFVTGGMSMGRYDYVPRILTELGGDLKITKLRIKPGKPFVLAAMPNGKYVFGLPGNPVSAMVCTLRLASRLLTRIAGGMPPDHLRTASLARPLEPNGPREFYQPAILHGDRVQPLAWKGSADIFTLAKANVLIVRPENAPALAAGGLVPIMELP